MGLKVKAYVEKGISFAGGNSTNPTNPKNKDAV